MRNIYLDRIPSKNPDQLEPLYRNTYVSLYCFFDPIGIVRFQVFFNKGFTEQRARGIPSDRPVASRGVCSADFELLRAVPVFGRH